MDNASHVAVVNGRYNLLYNLPCFQFTHTTFFLYPFIEFTTTSAFHDHDKLFAFNKSMIELDDVLMDKFLE